MDGIALKGRGSRPSPTRSRLTDCEFRPSSMCLQREMRGKGCSAISCGRISMNVAEISTNGCSLFLEKLCDTRAMRSSARRAGHFALLCPSQLIECKS